jgi:hypothetical protein
MGVLGVCAKAELESPELKLRHFLAVNSDFRSWCKAFKVRCFYEDL